MPRIPATRLVRLLACAAVPVTLVAGCSWGTSGAPGPGAGVTSDSPPPSPSPAAARYAALPAPCTAISRATVKSLVPGSTKPAGTVASSGEPENSGGCSWNGLAGYQYRYLDYAFQRFDTVAGTQSAPDQARSAYRAAVLATASSVAAGATTAPLDGVGDEAALITWDTGKDHAVYRNATVVARSANAVVTVDYTGAGLQGAHPPGPAGMTSGVQRAVSDAIAALTVQAPPK